MNKGPVSNFIEHHYRHFNAAALMDAAKGYVTHMDEGGKMMVTLAGATSTAELGISFAEMIRQERKAIYLISKEAVNNVFKYAECSNIYYMLTVHGSKWHLQIQDDGKGFILTENTAGNGLKNMQARATEVAAKFNIQSQPGTGTTIQVEL